MAAVRRWAERRKALGIRNEVLVCILQGGPVSDKYVRALMARLAAAAGIEKRVHSHGLRHTHAVELAAEGVPVNVISRQLGHANSAVTARYLDRVAPAQVIETMQQRNGIPLLGVLRKRQSSSQDASLNWPGTGWDPLRWRNSMSHASLTMAAGNRITLVWIVPCR